MIDFKSIKKIYIIVEPETSKKERDIILNMLNLLSLFERQTSITFSDSKMLFAKNPSEHFQGMLEDMLYGEWDLIINALPEFSPNYPLENLICGVSKGLGKSKLITRKQLRNLVISKIIDLEEEEDYEQ